MYVFLCFRIKTYEHENSWGQAVCSFDMELRHSSSLQLGLLNSLQKFGANHILDIYMKGLATQRGENKELDEIRYEAAWRNGQWDLETPAEYVRSSGIKNK